MTDADDGPPHPRRPSAAHDRPARAPFGPRIRTRPPRHSPDVPSPGPPASPQDDQLDPDDFPHAPDPPAHVDAAVQTPPPPDAAAPPKSAPTTFVAPPPLTPPPAISFESTPIPWKGLPLEAAQWTFSSSELQEIVSNSIRLSARESFVRLLSLQALEVDTVQEAERLDAERAAAQAKWRFELGRRTMLVQALNSVAASAPGDPNGTAASPIPGFIAQLATSIAACDALLASVLHLSDQQSQIALAQHQHWASALSVALRKLNRAYERQGDELKHAQARVHTLEDELEEAWREAEKMAIEFDDFEQEAAASTEDGSQGREDGPEPADVDTGPEQALEASQRDPDETGTLGDATINTDIAVLRGVTAIAVASKATLVNSPGSPKLPDRSDTKSVRSVKSSRSRRSTRDGPTHASRVSSARLRSRTASNASLRLPKSLRSTPSPHPPGYADAPPIPALPQDHSFLDMDNEHVRKTIPPQRFPEPMAALPTPPHSAGPSESRVPSIWIEADGGNSTRLNGLDRTHTLQIFSSLMTRTPRKTRRSKLVMSLTGSDKSLDSPGEGASRPASVSGSGVRSRPDSGGGAGKAVDAGTSGGNGNGYGGASTPSPTSNNSPVSLPTHALAHFRGPSLSSESRSLIGAPRPGSAEARLTTTPTTASGSGITRTPRRSLVSRASSVILRRLSQATMGSTKSGGSGAKGAAKSLVLASPSKSRSRETLGLPGSARLERCNEGQDADVEGEGEGEVILIGSPHADSSDGT